MAWKVPFFVGRPSPNSSSAKKARFVAAQVRKPLAVISWPEIVHKYSFTSPESTLADGPRRQGNEIIRKPAAVVATLLVKIFHLVDFRSGCLSRYRYDVRG